MPIQRRRTQLLDSPPCLAPLQNSHSSENGTEQHDGSRLRNRTATGAEVGGLAASADRTGVRIYGVDDINSKSRPIGTAGEAVFGDSCRMHIERQRASQRTTGTASLRGDHPDRV